MRKSLVTATAALALLSVAASAQTPAPADAAKPAAPAEQKPAEAKPAEDQVLATVDGQPIKMSDVMRAMESMPPQVRQLPPEMVTPVILDQLINGKLVAKAGYEAGVQNSDEAKARMKAAEERIVQGVYLDQEVEKRINEDAIKAAYEDWKKANPPEAQVRARHILVADEAKAKDIIAQLDKGGDFAKLAQENSTDGAAAQGGDLGYFKKGDMVPEFADAADVRAARAKTRTTNKAAFRP